MQRLRKMMAKTTSWTVAEAGTKRDPQKIISDMINLLRYKDDKNAKKGRLHKDKEIQRATALRKCLTTLGAIRRNSKTIEETKAPVEIKSVQQEIAKLLTRCLNEEFPEEKDRAVSIPPNYKFGKIYKMCVEVMPEAFIMFVQQYPRGALLQQAINNGALLHDINPTTQKIILQNPVFKRLPTQITHAISVVSAVADEKQTSVHATLMELLQLANALIEQSKYEDQFDDKWFDHICMLIKDQIGVESNDAVINTAITALKSFMENGRMILQAQQAATPVIVMPAQSISDEIAAAIVRVSGRSVDELTDEYVTELIEKLPDHHLMVFEKLVLANHFIQEAKETGQFDAVLYKNICLQIKDILSKIRKTDVIVNTAITALTHFSENEKLLKKQLSAKGGASHVLHEEKSSKKAMQEVQWKPVTKVSQRDVNVAGELVRHLQELHRYKTQQNVKFVRTNREIEKQRDELVGGVLAQVNDLKTITPETLTPLIVKLIEMNVHNRCHKNQFKNFAKKENYERYVLQPHSNLGTVHKLCVEMLPNAYVEYLWQNLTSRFAHHCLLFKTGSLEKLETGKNALSDETRAILDSNPDYLAFKALRNLFLDVPLVPKLTDGIHNQQPLLGLQEKIAERKARNFEELYANHIPENNTALENAFKVLEEIRTKKLDAMDGGLLQTFISDMTQSERKSSTIIPAVRALQQEVLVYCQAIVKAQSALMAKEVLEIDKTAGHPAKPN